MNHGEFSGDPAAVWLAADGTEDRDMELLEKFYFKDPSGKKWVASKGDVVNGASIPRVLWTLIGSPYTGDYRRASIVHDVACGEAGDDKKKRRAADRMFFHACRAGGCSVWQATLLYIGVRVGAAAPDVPSWQAAVAAEGTGPRIRQTADELRLQQDFQTLSDRVLAAGETDDPAELELRTDDGLLSITGTAVPDGRKSRSRRGA